MNIYCSSFIFCMSAFSLEMKEQIFLYVPQKKFQFSAGLVCYDTLLLSWFWNVSGRKWVLMTIYSFSVFKIYTTAKALLLLDEIFIGCPYSTKESSPKKHKKSKKSTTTINYIISIFFLHRPQGFWTRLSSTSAI